MINHINKKEFNDILKYAYYGIEEKNPLFSGADSFIFDGKTIKTFNEWLGVSITYETKITGAFPARLILNFLDSAQTENIQYEQDNNVLLLQAGRQKCKVQMVDDEVTFRHSKLMATDLDYRRLPEDFNTNLRISALTHHKDLDGVYVDGERIIATDGIAISICAQDANLPPTWFPAKVVKCIGSMPAFTEMAITNSWVYLKNKNSTIMTRTHNTDNYPKERLIQYIDSAFAGTPELSFVLDDAILSKLRKLATFSDDRDNKEVTLSFTKGEMDIYSGGARGEIESCNENVTYFNKEFYGKFTVNIQVLLTAIGKDASTLFELVQLGKNPMLRTNIAERLIMIGIGEG